MSAAFESSNYYSTIVQITDTHLYASEDGSLLGIPTRESFRAVVEQVVREESDVQLILGTGDISQDGSLAAYQYFVAETQRIGAPMRWLAGNHDEAQILAQASQAGDWLEWCYDLPAWRVVMLDSSVAGAVHGRLQADQLVRLEQALSSAGERHVLVCLHHHPVPMGSPWLDRLDLHNADELFAILDRYPQVKAVLWGHVHQELDQERRGVRLLAAPSTCVQFAPQSADFAVDQQAPGYRWLRLYTDGSLVTGVSRVREGLFTADGSAMGY